MGGVDSVDAMYAGGKRHRKTRSKSRSRKTGSKIGKYGAFRMKKLTRGKGPGITSRW